MHFTAFLTCLLLACVVISKKKIIWRNFHLTFLPARFFLFPLSPIAFAYFEIENRAIGDLFFSSGFVDVFYPIDGGKEENKNRNSEEDIKKVTGNCKLPSRLGWEVVKLN
jgi:hypothetical protein